MGLTIYMQWKSTQRAQYRRWLNSVYTILFIIGAALIVTVSSADSNGMMGSMMQDLAFAIPGVDEAMSFAEIMK